jgi:hypothetical protein
MVKGIAIILILLSFIVVGCAPAPFIAKEPLQVKFDPTPKYEVDLSGIIQPDKPVKVWLDKQLNVIQDSKDAKYLLLTQKEYAKYVVQLQIKETYKEIIMQQEILINTYIDQINSLKEYIALEQAKAQSYRGLWVDSENAYRQERYDHKMSNLINKGVTGAISLGALILLILAL